jgi:hypothetical protein
VVSTRKYYKMLAESIHDGSGSEYVEVSDRVITRQVFEFGDRLYWANPEGYSHERYMFTDQPEWMPSSSDEDIPEVEITDAQFEDIWVRSQTQ